LNPKVDLNCLYQICQYSERKREDKGAEKSVKSASPGGVGGAGVVPPDISGTGAAPVNGNGHAQPPRCDHCAQWGATGLYDGPHRPGGITLHSSCEAPWFDSEARQ